LEGICRVPLSDLFATTTPGSDFKSASFSLTADDNHKRANSVSQLVNPNGISKENVRGFVSFSFAYITDEMMKKEGVDKIPNDG